MSYFGWENEALPLGNGKIGAKVFGGKGCELIQFNEKTLWSGGSDVEGFNSGVRDFSEFNYNLRGTVERMDVAMRDVVSAMRETAKSIERSGRT